MPPPPPTIVKPASTGKLSINAVEEVEQATGFDSDDDDDTFSAAKTGPAAARARALSISGGRPPSITKPPSASSAKGKKKQQKKASTFAGASTNNAQADGWLGGATTMKPAGSLRSAATLQKVYGNNDMDVDEVYVWRGAQGVKATTLAASKSRSSKKKVKRGSVPNDFINDSTDEEGGFVPDIGPPTVPTPMSGMEGKKRTNSEKVLASHKSWANVNPKVQNMKPVLKTPLQVQFADFLFTSSWAKVMLVMLVVHFLLIVIFAALFSIEPEGIYGCYSHWHPERTGTDDDIDDDIDDWFDHGEGPCRNRFENAFYLSVQTFTTVGYGTLQPSTVWTHILVALEGFTALMFGTIVGGGIFLKLIKPIPRIVFSDKMVIFHKDADGNAKLRFRSVMADGFKMYYTSARLKVHLAVRDEHNRLISVRDAVLPLEQEDHSLMSSCTTYTHEINEKSELRGLISGSNKANGLNYHVAKFSLIVQGDESQGFMTTYSGRTWDPEDVYFGHRFQNCYTPNPEDPEELGSFDAEKVHDIEICPHTHTTREQTQHRKGSEPHLMRKGSTENSDMYFTAN
jgi:hypothetical protein